VTATHTDSTIHETRPVTTPSPLCHCGHDLRAHDAIAGRFCRATKAADVARGCACGPIPPRQIR
jgi:hypothetical protein